MMCFLTLALALMLAATPALAQHHRPGGWHPGGGGHHPNVWHHGPGGNVAGGILGGIIGSWLFRPNVVIEQPTPEIVPGSPAWQAYCASKYRSWDGTSYLGYDGVRHPCV